MCIRDRYKVREQYHWSNTLSYDSIWLQKWIVGLSLFDSIVSRSLKSRSTPACGSVFFLLSLSSFYLSVTLFLSFVSFLSPTSSASFIFLFGNQDGVELEFEYSHVETWATRRLDLRKYYFLQSNLVGSTYVLYYLPRYDYSPNDSWLVSYLCPITDATYPIRRITNLMFTCLIHFSVSSMRKK